LLTVLVLLFVVLGVSGAYRYADNFWLYRGFAKPQDPAFVHEHGKLVVIHVKSAALGGRKQEVAVYLPPGYSTHPHRRYPVLYVLHGFPGSPVGLFNTVRLGVVEDELVALKKAQPLILALPFGSSGIFEDKEWANSVHPYEGWETFFARDVVRAIDSRYRTIPRAAARGVAGLSEGGYGALNIAFHHPREFSLIESWSGYMSADNILSIFGGKKPLLRYNSPNEYLPTVAKLLHDRHVFVWFYSGTKDTFLPQNRAFKKELGEYGIAHHFFVLPGGHTWVAWRSQARNAYLVAAHRLKGAEKSRHA
jgi:enterochelin esterase-like enzyme